MTDHTSLENKQSPNFPNKIIASSWSPNKNPTEWDKPERESDEAMIAVSINQRRIQERSKKRVKRKQPNIGGKARKQKNQTKEDQESQKNHQRNEERKGNQLDRIHLEI